MMRFWRSTICSLLQMFLLLLLHVLPLTTADPIPLETLYRLPRPGANGNCDDQISTLRTAYTEGLAMTQAAIDAIDAVKNGRMTNWVMSSKNNRKAKTLQAMFGIRAASFTRGISSGDSAALDTVRGIYSKRISTANEGSSQSYSLYCGDSYFNLYKPTDKDPSKFVDPIPKLSDSRPDLNPFGGWYDGEFDFFKSKAANEQRQNIFCQPTTAAFTIRGFNSITWCPNAFSGFSGGKKYLASVGDIQANQKQIKKDDSLDKYFSLAATWLHEWTHLLGETKDQQRYDGSGNSIDGSSYGFFNCANLARKNPDGQSLAIANADTYAYFAMAMYFGDWDWSSGIAANSLGF